MTTEKRVHPKKQASLTDVSLWQIDVRRAIALVLGITLCVLLQLALNQFALPNAAAGLITVHPDIVIPLFCGFVFGPIVGLCVGGGSYVLGDLLRYHTLYWNWDLGLALMGLLMGLSLLFTARRSGLAAMLVLAEIACLIAVVYGVGFAALTDIWVSGIDLKTALGELLFTGTSNVVNGLLLLPLLLLVSRFARLLLSWRGRVVSLFQEVTLRKLSRGTE